MRKVQQRQKLKMKEKSFTPLEITGAKKKRKENKSLTGFTLIEIMVAITIFSIIIEIITGLFISGINQQKRALDSQAILDQTGYALEYMSRALRLAVKQPAVGFSCLSSAGLNYEITQGGLGIKFINHLQADDCQEFFLENSQLKYRRKIGQPEEETLPLTSDKLEMVSFKLNLIGESQADDLQPELTVFLIIRKKGVSQSPAIKIQTTISQRNLDVVY